MSHGLSTEQKQQLREKFRKRKEQLEEEAITRKDKYQAVLSGHYGVDDPDYAAKLAAGIEGIEEFGDGDRPTDSLRNELNSAFGVDMDSLNAVVRSWEKRGKDFDIDKSNTNLSQSAPEELSGDFESWDELKQAIKSHDNDPEDLLLVPDSQGHFSQLIQDLNQADKELGPENVAVGRKEDIGAAKKAREDLVESVSQQKGIRKDEIEDMSLAALSRLSDDSDGKSNPSPAPRSGDPNPDDTIPRGKGSEYEKLQEQKEFYERKSGILAEKELERVEERLAELKGR